MNRVFASGWLLIFFLALLSPNDAAAGIVVDGDLSDWGVTKIADGNQSNWGGVPGVGQRTIGAHTYFTFLEDNSDLAGDGGLLGPQYGGQNYDAEFLAVGINGNNLVIAISTGQRPDNSEASGKPKDGKRFAPGDIRIGTSLGYFGVEVGGGAYSGDIAGGSITEGADGSFYNLDSKGFTIDGNDGLPGLAVNSSTYVAGSVWRTDATDWQLDPITNNLPVQLKFDMAPTKLMGEPGQLADFIYTRNSFTSQHAVIEVSIPFSMFLNAAITSVSWSPSCGNDIVSVDIPAPGGLMPTPAPATLPLFLLGFLGVARSRAFRNRQ